MSAKPNPVLQIDPEFESKIPPLTEEEYQQLAENIISEGVVLMPLIVWNGMIVDGHNRYKIVQEHPEIVFTVHEKDFDNRYEALVWICNNQLGRRNLTPVQKKMLVGDRYEAEKMAHGSSERFCGNHDDSPCGQNGHMGESDYHAKKLLRKRAPARALSNAPASFRRGPPPPRKCPPAFGRRSSPARSSRPRKRCGPSPRLPRRSGNG